MPPGPNAHGATEPTTDRLRLGLFAMRLGVGVALISLAFTEKGTNPEMFGQTELVGHLPVYGVFLAMLAYGSNARTAPLVAWLPGLPRLRRRQPILTTSRLTPSEPVPSGS